MRIAVLDDYQQVARGFADWDSLGAEVTTFTEHLADPDELVRALAGFDVVVAMRERTAFPAEVLDRLPDLGLLVSTGRRNPAIDVSAAARNGIVVSTTGSAPYATAEHTWALILAAMRNIPADAASMGRGGWQTGVGRDLHGRTLGLLGLGRLGSRVAAVGQAFGMRTVAWSHNLTAEHAAERDVTAVSERELFAESDVLSIHLVLSERTRGLVDAERLAAMKRDSLLVNTSRGPIVTEDALLRALADGRPARAALDVYDREPLPADHPLRTLSNVLLTPHTGYVTEDVYRTFYQEAVEDIAAYQAGTPIRQMPAPQ